MKEVMSNPTVLAFPDDKKQFFVHADASKFALGAVLMEKNEKKKLSAVQCTSRSISKAEQSFSTFERENVVVIFALKKFRHHLLGDPFVVYSDHKALRGAFEKVEIHGRLSRWLDIVAEHAFEIRQVDGKGNVLDDYLSRSISSPSRPNSARWG